MIYAMVWAVGRVAFVGLLLFYCHVTFLMTNFFYIFSRRDHKDGNEPVKGIPVLEKNSEPVKEIPVLEKNGEPVKGIPVLDKNGEPVKGILKVDKQSEQNTDATKLDTEKSKKSVKFKEEISEEHLYPDGAVYIKYRKENNFDWEKARREEEMLKKSRSYVASQSQPRGCFVKPRGTDVLVKCHILLNIFKFSNVNDVLWFIVLGSNLNIDRIG